MAAQLGEPSVPLNATHKRECSKKSRHEKTPQQLTCRSRLAERGHVAINYSIFAVQDRARPCKTVQIRIRNTGKYIQVSTKEDACNKNRRMKTQMKEAFYVSASETIFIPWFNKM